MADAFAISFDESDIVAALEQFSDDVVNTVPRPVAQAGAQVFYEEIRDRAPRSEKEHWFHGTSFRKTGQKYLFQPGSLRAAVYQVFSKDNSWDGHATYHVAWNHQKVPYGFMVEFGTSRAPAHPFLRPGFYAAQPLALEAARLEVERRVGQLIQEMGA